MLIYTKENEWFIARVFDTQNLWGYVVQLIDKKTGETVRKFKFYGHEEDAIYRSETLIANFSDERMAHECP